jgi:hypothetical protein
MNQFTVLIKSNHQDGDAFENQIKINVGQDVIEGEFDAVDWVKINGDACSNASLINLIKSEMQANGIEVMDPEYWTTEAYIVGVNNESIPEDFDFYTIEDRIRTGDLI